MTFDQAVAELRRADVIIVTAEGIPREVTLKGAIAWLRHHCKDYRDVGVCAPTFEEAEGKRVAHLGRGMDTPAG